MGSRLATELPPVLAGRPANGDALGIESIKLELQKLAAANQEIMKAFQPRGEAPSTLDSDIRLSGSGISHPPSDELTKTKRSAELYKKENENLRRRLAEYESQPETDTPVAWHEQQAEFEEMLVEKTETIRVLNLRVQQLQEELRGGPSGPTREQLDARQSELDALAERLREDEEALNRQAREMELSMARDRADLARQRSELQRLHEDIQREIDMASRDPGLRERLASLQRRPDGRPKTSTSLSSVMLPATSQSGVRPPTNPAIELESDENVNHKPSLLRRIFGGS